MTVPGYRVLTDDDVRALWDMPFAVRKMEDALREHTAGTLVAPPRFSLDTPQGALVFTTGAAMGGERVAGFRVYGTFQDAGTDTTQLTAVFDPYTGNFKGVIIGSLVGALRTGALGGVAIKCLAREDARTLVVFGSGLQARTQVAAAMAVRPIETVLVCGRNQTNAERFARDTDNTHGTVCEIATSPRDAVERADIVICATNSMTPVLAADWVQVGTHVSSLGPKFAGAQEIPDELVKRCQCIATDSVAQVESYENFFCSGPFTGLDALVAGTATGRKTAEDTTLFCSIGLAGTEVVLANALFERAAASG